MIRITIFIFFSFLNLSYSAKELQLPSSFKRCSAKLSDSELNVCLNKALNEALVDLKDGNAMLDVAALDPMFVPSIEIAETKERPVSISMNHKNLTVEGVTKCTTPDDKFSFDRTTGEIKAVADCKKYILSGPYEVKGKVLLLPVNGKGKCKIVLEDNKVGINMKSKIIQKDGLSYIDVDELKISLNPSKVTFDFENLLPGDKSLTKNLNGVLNENWKDVMKDMGPAYESLFSQIFLNVAQKVFSKTPLKNILLDYNK